MTTQRDLDALLTGYMVDGMNVLPDRVVDAVLRAHDPQVRDQVLAAALERRVGIDRAEADRKSVV